MNIFKSLYTFIFTTILLLNPAIAESQKLVDKLAKGTIHLKVNVAYCNSDAAKFCPGLPLNSKKSFMCLSAYEDKLSEECKLGIIEAATSVEKSMLSISYSVQACEYDADKFCLDITPGEGRMISCLKKHETKLTKQCTTALKKTGLWNIKAKN